MRFTYKRDAGSQQQDSDEQVLKLLDDQLPDALAWRTPSTNIIWETTKRVSAQKDVHLQGDVGVNDNTFYWHLLTQVFSSGCDVIA